MSMSKRQGAAERPGNKGDGRREVGGRHRPLPIVRILPIAHLLLCALFPALLPPTAAAQPCDPADTQWLDAGGGLNGDVRTMFVFDDGAGPALFVGGDFTSAAGAPLNHIGAWSGEAWRSLGAGIDGSVRALAAFDDGSGPAIYAAGSFQSAGGVAAGNIARWDGAQWSALGEGVGAGVVAALEVFDDGRGPALYAGGTFKAAGGKPAQGVARWDGKTWSAIGGGALNVKGLVAHDDGTGFYLFVLGDFDGPVKNIARWDGASWYTVGTLEGETPLFLAAGPSISPKRLFAGMYTADELKGPPDIIENYAVRRWNGADWTTLWSVTWDGWSCGDEYRLRLLEIVTETGTRALYRGVEWYEVDLVNCVSTYLGTRIERFAVGNSWEQVGPISHPIRTLAWFDDPGLPGGTLYAGPGFLRLWCPPPSCPADLDGDGSLTLFDFLLFTNLFNAADPGADCNQDGAFTLFDFLCYLNAFNEGC